MFALLIIPGLCFGQYDIHTWPDCNGPYSVFSSDHLPQVISPDTGRELEILKVQSITYYQNDKGSYRVGKYTRTEFDGFGRIISHYGVDSLWERKSWLFKNTWKVMLCQAIMFYSDTESFDSMKVVILDNHPERRRDNLIERFTCSSDTIYDAYWTDVSNREFEKQLKVFAKSPPPHLGYDYIIQRAGLDTSGISKWKFRQRDFAQSDTSHGCVKHAYTEPTLIFDVNGRLQRRFPRPPDFQAYFDQHYYVDYHYATRGQLVRVERVGYDEPYSDYYFFNELGLISSIWEERGHGLGLKTVFLYEIR